MCSSDLFLKDYAQQNGVKICGVNADCGTVIPPDPAPTCSVTANPGVIKVNEKVTLTLISQGKVTSASIALGHVSPVIWRATQAEKMLVGKTITAATADAAGEAAVANATPLSGNKYKVQLTKVAVKRALLAAAGIKA